MKSQAEVISLVLVFLIAMGLLYFTFGWFYPWVERRRDEIKLERVLSNFDPSNPNSLPRKIEEVANTGGVVKFRVGERGVWNLYPHNAHDPLNNSLEFSFFSRIITHKIPRGEWKSFEGKECKTTVGSISEKPFLVCLKADEQANGYLVKLRVVFRELCSVGNCVKILLSRETPLSPLSSTSKTITIRGSGTTSSVERGIVIILKEVKISLV